MLIITMMQTDLTKNPNTKTTYFEDKRELSTITEEQYNLITNDDTLKCFRRLGGTETSQKGYECNGFVVYKLTSTSPNKQRKTIREFNFEII